jgi:menaquinol-cytochrome c reductase iron-sulfur subunit
MDFPEQSVSFPRRRLLANGIKALVGLFGLALGIPLVGFFLSPALKKDRREWIEIADLGQMRDGEPTKIPYRHMRKDGWKMVETRRTAFLMQREDGSLIALTNRCTHLGCGVDWNSNAQRFICPCHGGAFDALGRVLEGPPPKALEQLPVKVEGKKIFLREA